jgi:hypothetical protein
MRFVSYYTSDYIEYAKPLINSLQKFNLSYDIEQIPDRGSWDRNTKYKPNFMLEKMRVYDEPITWVDIDAIVKDYPQLLFELTCDLAARFKITGRLMSGTVFINNTDNGKELLRRWVWSNTSRKQNDQKNLQHVIQDETVVQLPKSYCRKFDEDGDVVIKHMMASRKLGRG